MRRLVLAPIAALLVMVCLPAAARAQAAQASMPPPMPSTGMGFSIGVFGGGAAVQKVGGLFGGEVNFAASDTVEIFGEGAWMQDVITRRRLDHVGAITSYLQTSQGKTATGTLTAPAGYAGGGARIMLVQGPPSRIKPYVAISVGVAHVAITPAFTLGGVDITTSLSQYGVQLGSDLTGEETVAAFGGGAGVRTVRGKIYIDGGFRILSIRAADQPITVSRIAATVGYRF
jgi:hypothetical protein